MKERCVTLTYDEASLIQTALHDLSDFLTADGESDATTILANDLASRFDSIIELWDEEAD